MLQSGLHQIVVEYANLQGGAYLDLVVTDTDTATDVSLSFVHDPAGPCNADCAVCNTAQQYCMTCAVFGSLPVGGVCPSPYDV